MSYHSPTCTGCPQCNPVFAALLNATPREQAQFNLARVNAQRTTGVPAALTAGSSNEPPAPPSLAAAVGGKPVEYPPTYIFGRPAQRPLVAAGGVPEVPSLTDAIVSARKGGRR